MEPTLSQIKEYLREKQINIFEVFNIEQDKESNNLYGGNQIEVYYQYYLEHSNEIIEWVMQNLNNEEKGFEL